MAHFLLVTIQPIVILSEVRPFDFAQGRLRRTKSKNLAFKIPRRFAPRNDRGGE